ncbi:MAG: enoyl-CoA hydratase/isomerase family protein [Candidatus Rokubacteria bacterium]|nr:enoyl-CoA hydratase/isomerase family protein [Candidatus Rokubacteria bacterium]
MSGAASGALRVERAGAVATVTIDRPKARNALDPVTIRALDATLAALEDDEALLAVVLTGAGDDVFVSGGDLKALQKVAGAEAGRRMARATQRVFARLEALEVPVIAAINGATFGGGTELAAACDIRIATETARFGFKQVQMGIMPAWGLSYRLPRIVGRSRALELLLTGRTLTAREAKDWGFVDRVVAAREAGKAALELAQAIAGNPPLSVRLIKQAVQGGRDAPAEAAGVLEAALFGLTWGSDDHAEAVRAFFEKRAPRWRGR